MSPHAIRLPRFFHVPSLLRDLEAIPESAWIIHGDQPDWVLVPLRSRGGSVLDWTPGITSSEPFEDTITLAFAPYIKSVLESFATVKCDVLSARLSAVHPGGRIREHRDRADEKLAAGHQVRLHVPIRTHPDARLYIDDHYCDWRAGELWWGDFSKPHRVENDSLVTRVHLIVCVVVSEELLVIAHAYRQTAT